MLRSETRPRSKTTLEKREKKQENNLAFEEGCEYRNYGGRAWLVKLLFLEPLIFLSVCHIFD